MINILFPGKYKMVLMLLGDIFTSLHFAVQSEGLSAHVQSTGSLCGSIKLKPPLIKSARAFSNLAFSFSYLEEAYERTSRPGCLSDTFN